MALHFVGFRGEEYRTACRVFGDPDFIHVCNDTRFRCEVFDGDTVIFANGSENKPTQYNRDDSRFF